MPVYALDESIAFPDPRLAGPGGLLAVGGDLSPRRLLTAYAIGVFLWPMQGVPLAWFSPDPRMVLYPEDLHVSRSQRKVMRRGTYELRMDTAFGEVIDRCSSVPRPGQEGTWITDEMVEAYVELHELGFAHSVESWQDGRLVGGLYGVSIGSLFCGESMFFDEPNASKAAFVALIRQLEAWDFDMVDCQVYTEHLARFGAQEIPRERFLEEIDAMVRRPTRRGRWTLEIDPTDE